MYIESLFRNSLHYSVPGAPLYGSLNPRRPENCVWWVLFVRWLGRPVNGSPTTMNLYPLIFIAVFTHGCERTHTHTHRVSSLPPPGRAACPEPHCSSEPHGLTFSLDCEGGADEGDEDDSSAYNDLGVSAKYDIMPSCRAWGVASRPSTQT